MGRGIHTKSPQSGLIYTVGSGQDYATIAAALADNYQCNGLILNITDDRNEALDLNDGNVGSATILGDNREIVGITFEHGRSIYSSTINAGSGIAALSNSGNDITIAGSSTNPDFDAEGIGNGDKLRIIDDSGNYTENTVSSSLNETITLTGTAPAVGGAGSSVTFVPNRKLYNSSSIPLLLSNNLLDLTIQGMSIETSGTAGIFTILLAFGVRLTLKNCVVSDFRTSGGFPTIRVEENATLSAISECSVVKCLNTGIETFMGGVAFLNTIFVGKCGGLGVAAFDGGKLRTTGAKITHCEKGIFVSNARSYSPTTSTTKNNIGFWAGDSGRIHALGCSTLASGNVTDFSPSSSDTEGNVDGYIKFS